jgi:actin-related protein
MNYFENEPIIADIGTAYIRAGFAGDELPRLLLPTVLGNSIYSKAAGSIALQTQSTYAGHEAIKHKGILKLRCPIEHGIVSSWTDMEILWENMFDQLRVISNERPILLTETPLNPSENRVKMAEIMFETFQVPVLYIAIQAVLAAYCHNTFNCLSVYSGDGTTHMVPIYEGFALKNLTVRTDLAGNELTDYLKTLLQIRGYNFCRTCKYI